MISTALHPIQSIWNSLIPFWHTISIFFLLQSVWNVMYAVQVQCRESRKLKTHSQDPLYFLAEEIPSCIYIEWYHRAYNRGMYADGYYECWMVHKDSCIPSQRIMFTSTALHHATLQWQKNSGFYSKASQWKLKVDKSDRSNYFNYKNGGGNNPLCCTATCRKLLTSSGIAKTCTFMMNTWNTLLESYQQRVHKHTSATVNRQVQQAENPTAAVVISMEAAQVDNPILLDNLTSEWNMRSLRSESLTQTSWLTTLVWMTNCIFGCQRVGGITQLNMTKVIWAMPSPPPAGDDKPRLNSDGLPWWPVMSRCMRAWMATMRIQMRTKMHRKPIMAQRRMWCTEDLVLESAKTGWQISDLFIMMMVKHIQWHAMYLKRRLHCNKWQHLKAEHIWGDYSIWYIPISKR